jgi:outer membrane biosynthesis protein TonB
MTNKEKEVLKNLKALAKSFNTIEGLKDDSDKAVAKIKIPAKSTVDEAATIIEDAFHTVGDIAMIPTELIDEYERVVEMVSNVGTEVDQKEETQNETQENETQQNETQEVIEEPTQRPAVESKLAVHDVPKPKPKPQKKKTKPQKKPAAGRIEDKIVMDLYNQLDENQIDQLKPDTMRAILKLNKK